jgi:hypothetical protein
MGINRISNIQGGRKIMKITIKLHSILMVLFLLTITSTVMAQMTPKPVLKPFPRPTPMPVCGSGKVSIPPAAQDSSPLITINAVASGGGYIQYPEASPSICASPCQCAVGLNTELVITINATNPGGVKNIGVTVKPPDGPAYGIERNAQPDAKNCVYPSLGIVGHNGAGGIGGNPILFRMKQHAARGELLVRATNYNGQSSLYTITYFVQGGVQASISASKQRIRKGESSTLTWNTTNANTVELQPLGPKPRSGSLPVTPTSTTTYSLIAHGNYETVKKDVTVVVEEPQQAPPQQGLQVGCLGLHFGFTWGSYPAELAGKTLPITVHYHGTRSGGPLPHNAGKTVFDLTQTYKLNYPYTPTWTGVNENIGGLMPGTWSVTAQYTGGLGGLKVYGTPIVCTGTVTAGPACGNVYFNHDEQNCSNR